MTLKTLSPIIACLIVSVGIQAHSAVSKDIEAASTALGASMVTEVTFEPGQAKIGEELKKEIREFVQKAQASGEITDIKIAAWSDSEYPAQGKKSSDADIKLAEKRAEEMTRYLNNELKIDRSDIDTFNMAKRPNALQKLVRTPDSKLKGTLEKKGAAPKAGQDMGLFDRKSQVSKAIVMVYFN